MIVHALDSGPPPPPATFSHPQLPREAGRTAVASGGGGAGGGAGVRREGGTGWHRVAPWWRSRHGNPFRPAGRLPPTSATFHHPQPRR
jgi:hypothetical protein